MDTSSENIERNIICLREEKRVSRVSVYREIGFGRRQMSNIEVGKGNPTLATIEKIAHALGVASDELLK